MKKYVLCGASRRGHNMYAANITAHFTDVAQLVGIFDINPMRAEYVRDCVDERKSIPVFTDFDEMLRTTNPDTVIVTTVDSVHHEYVIRSLDLGLDVICEKPMTIDAEKTKAILEAEKRNNRKIIVTFNCRFIPYIKRVKELIADGAVGTVLSVDFEWLLDRHHGADYFRRWHRFQENSGGLLVTKSTHHFDMINWWLGESPVKVYADGELSFYGPHRENRAERCRDCAFYKSCDLAMDGFDDLNDQNSSEYLNKMYFEPEKIDGYRRDQCVFAPSDIYDNMSVSVRYTNGVLLTYSLNAYMPYEGWRAAINGTKGRLEAQRITRGLGKDDQQTISVFYPGQEKTVYHVPKATGSHGGGDRVLLDWLFREPPDDPLGQMAGSREGALSLLIGAAANISIKTGDPVTISNLVDLP